MQTKRKNKLRNTKFKRSVAHSGLWIPSIPLNTSLAKPIKQSHYKFISTVKSVILNAFKQRHMPNTDQSTQVWTFLVIADCDDDKHGYRNFWPKTQDGLTVVDVYTEWSGPCAAMQATLKRAKLEVVSLLMMLVWVLIYMSWSWLQPQKEQNWRSQCWCF